MEPEFISWWLLAQVEFIRPFEVLVFCPAGCHAILLTGKTREGSRFRRRLPDHVGVVLGYIVTSSRTKKTPWPDNK